MTNNVKIFQDSNIITSDKAIYYPENSTILLKENVIVNRATSIGKGEKFIYDLKTKNGNFINNEDDTILLIINEDIND